MEEGKYAGSRREAGERSQGGNSVEEIEMGDDTKGTLEPGRYILLRYLDPPWQGFYDIFKIVNEDLLIGRVYLGEFPNGARVLTFPMSRLYTFDQMTAQDHQAMYSAAAVPAPADLAGVWRIDAGSHPDHAGGIPYLQFN